MELKPARVRVAQGLLCAAATCSSDVWMDKMSSSGVVVPVLKISTLE